MYKNKIHKYKGKHPCSYCHMRFDKKKDLNEHHLHIHGKVSTHPRRDTEISKLFRKYYIRKGIKKLDKALIAEEDKLFLETVTFNGIQLEIIWKWNKKRKELIPYLTGTKYKDEVELMWSNGKLKIRGVKTLKEDWNKKHPIKKPKKKKTLLEKVKKVKKWEQ